MSSSQEPVPPSPPAVVRRPVRWWPAALILLLAGAASVWVRASYGRHRQDQNIAIASIAIITFVLLLLWCAFFSRLRAKIRLSILLAALAVVGLTPALFRIHGVTGDLVPILEFRWHRSSVPELNRQRTPVATVPARDLQFTNEYPQFLGPHRNATLEQPLLAPDWKAHPPQRLWLQPVGAGWSGFAVAGPRAITQEQRGEDEAVICYDLFSGAVLWAYSYPAHFQSSLAGEGPRATPTIDGQRVFALGSTGILNCQELENGKCIWSKDIVRDNQAEINEWGMAGSPLVTGGMVIVSAGGHNRRSLVAYQAGTGEFIWGAGADSAGYSSPYLVTLAEVPQILIFNSGGVAAHAPADGKILWKYPWPGGHPHVAMPVVLPGDKVLISSGYGVGSELIQVKKDADGKFSTARVWKSNRLKAKFTNVVYRDGYIYGLDDGIMVCVDAANGQLKWKEGRYGHGQEILAGDLLLVSAEPGEMILLTPTPQEPRELARLAVFNEKTWNPPALAGPYLLVRNDKEAACYKLPLR
jgi:outer membrane protein assembly factor BamB